MKQCPKCSTQHTKSGTFCSKKCANSRNFSVETRTRISNSNKEHAKLYRPLRQRTCTKCSAVFQHHRRKLCSACVQLRKNKNIKIRKPQLTKIQHTENIIQTGELFKRSESIIRRHMKRWLIHHTGHVCIICKQSGWNSAPIPLVCDHIDGDSSNSSVDNFRLVCCNCDAQLPTYKSKNRGKGRKYDRDAYHERKIGKRGRVV